MCSPFGLCRFKECCKTFLASFSSVTGSARRNACCWHIQALAYPRFLCRRICCCPRRGIRNRHDMLTIVYPWTGCPFLLSSIRIRLCWDAVRILDRSHSDIWSLFLANAGKECIVAITAGNEGKVCMNLEIVFVTFFCLCKKLEILGSQAFQHHTGRLNIGRACLCGFSACKIPLARAFSCEILGAFSRA